MGFRVLGFAACFAAFWGVCVCVCVCVFFFSIKKKWDLGFGVRGLFCGVMDCGVGRLVDLSPASFPGTLV
jgi:hypothetical protein